MPDVGFIGHLGSVAAYHAVLAAARGSDLPAPRLEDLERLLPYLEPMPLADAVIRTPGGREVRGRYFDLFFLPEETLRVKSGLDRVRAACAQAKSAGVRIGALGGFSSILGEMGRADLSQELGVPFTTGNALTAATVAAQVDAAVPRDAVVTIVGAGGDVGTGVCRLLARAGRRLVLVGRNPAAIDRLCLELPGARPRRWEDAAPEVEAAVLLASATGGAITLDGLPAGAIVLDGGHPANACPTAHIGYAQAGRVILDLVVDLPAVLEQHCRPNELPACLAEAVVLALEGRFEPYSTGRGHIQPDRAAEILAMAARHGITPAPLCWRKVPCK
jgi:fatty aldehyde-generating acyl-ACP reductase